MSAILTSNWFNADTNSISKIAAKQRQKSTKDLHGDVSKAGMFCTNLTPVLYRISLYIGFLTQDHEKM
jgi:hypothetical protein